MAKKARPVKADLPKYWYYLSEKELTVEDLHAALASETYDLQIWKEAGVLEVGVAEKASVDIEAWELDPEDEFDPGLPGGAVPKSIFGMTIVPEEPACKEAMQKIIKALGGMIISDDERAIVLRPGK